jgi:hypothetical protein
MQRHTIINAFASSGMWPPSAKARIKKMRSYRKKKRSINKVEEDDTLELPRLLPTRSLEIWNTAAAVQALDDQDPTLYSDNTIQVFYNTIKKVDIQL